MVNISRQRIGIYYRDKEWGKRCFKHIVNQIPQEIIDKVINNNNEMSCYLTNGDTIKALRASEGARGFKFTGAIVQDEVTKRVLQKIIYPCIQHPVSIIRDAEDVTATYAAIKQELPRQEIATKRKDKKFVKIKVRY